MLKFSEGQTFRTNRFTEFPEGYSNLGAGAVFTVKIAMETCEYGDLEYPYFVQFSNGFETSLDEKDIFELTCSKLEKQTQ